LDTVRAVLATTSKNKWKAYQIDVKLSFLNGIIEEEIYVQQPQGYEIEGNKDKVHRFFYGVGTTNMSRGSPR